jgi:hypothetical protein
MLEIIKNPKDKEYKETIEWLGGGFDPERFDLTEVNEMVEHYRDMEMSV